MSDRSHATRALRALSEALLVGSGARRVRLSVPICGVITVSVGADSRSGRPETDVAHLQVGPGGSLGSLEVEPAHAASGELIEPLLEAIASVVAWSGVITAPSVSEHGDATADPLRRLLEVGIHARSPLEAAEAIAKVAAEVLGFPVGCAYLVDPLGRISDVATVGAGPDSTQRLRECLVGRAASPVWRRIVEEPKPEPDLVADTRVPGAVRRGGLAETMGFRSMAGIPLHSSDGPLGLVVCGGPNVRSHWSAAERELLSQLALQGTIVVDNARLREAERREATYDSLTGLLNRRGFLDQLTDSLDAAVRKGTALAVVMLDLDHLKEVNDIRGHHFGDELLAAVGRRLRRIVCIGDHVGRVGGDEFALVLTSNVHPAQAASRAKHIVGALAASVVIEGIELSPSASLGVACFPSHGGNTATLLQMADSAMYQAKRQSLGFKVWNGD